MYFWIAFLRRSRGETPESNPELNRAIERAAEIGAALGDPVSQAIPSAFMAAGMIFTGEFRQGARQMEAALDIVADHVDPFSAAILGGLLTIANARLGDFAAAERSLARADDVERGQERVVGPIAHRAVQLGGDHHLLAALATLREPSTDDLFGPPLPLLPPVHVGCVEVVDAELDGAGHGLGLIRALASDLRDSVPAAA